MRFSSTLVSVLSLSSAVLGAPMAKRALTVKPYNDFSVSAGVAGDALAEVNTNFPVSTPLLLRKALLTSSQIDLNNLADVSAVDLKIISDAAKVSEQAEVATGGFNDALEGVTGDAKTA